MKTTTKKSLVTCVLFIFALFFFSNSAKSQVGCPYPVTNNMGCQVTITYQISSNGTWCTAVPNIQISAGATHNIPCSAFSACGTSNYDVRITITRLGGIGVPVQVTVESSNPGPSSFGPCSSDPNIPTACYNGTSELIDWNATGTTIY